MLDPSSQLSLFCLPQENKIQLELKPCIQPFEKILARAELAGLIKDISIPNPFSEFAEDYLSIASKVDPNLLNLRLAYWQKVGKTKLEPTLQTLYEIAESDFKYLPKNRRLRYGPHDIHEYRGKFFPQLVRSLINTSGISEGSTVIDPTCGSGTTNCESRAIGMKSLGVDMNPLSVLIANVKTSIIQIDSITLSQASDKILSVISKTKGDINCHWNSRDLHYLKTWFDVNALTEISQILTALKSESNIIIYNFFRVCLSNVIREVSWQKMSDLRVRKQIYSYNNGFAIECFEKELKRQVNKIIPYLNVNQVKNKSTFADFQIIEGDTRKLSSFCSEFINKCDLLITSPPYATALPYLDTDRLSLVILGLLPRKEHRDREKELIGNREISESQRQKLWEYYQQRKKELPESVSLLIDKIAEINHKKETGFRRKNLPALLSKYFLDMNDAMKQARYMMKDNKFGFYVVGNNSTYVGEEKVEISTDKFLWEIGENAGWSQIDVLNMELLPSRDIFCKNRGSSESILVFKSTVERKAIYSEYKFNQYNNQEDWNFEDEITNEHLHSLHPYPARFIPQIPRKAISLFSNFGDTILDPFAGSGTTLLESMLMGRKAIGIDNNPVANLITNAKITVYDNDDISCLRNFLKSLPLVIQQAPQNVWLPKYENFETWFDYNAISDLGKLKLVIERLPPKPRLFSLAIFSSIVVRASKQDSDTRYARTNRSYTQGDSISWFSSRLADLISKIEQVTPLVKSEAKAYLGDSRNLSFIADKTVDLIVTSPPYLNAYDYHKYHRHRIHWIQGDVEFARDLEIGKHDTFTRPNAKPELYFSDMLKCFTEWKRVLKSNGKIFIVIGDAIVNKKPVQVADRFTEMMNSLGLKVSNHWIREIKKSKKSFNSQARIDKEHILLYE